MPSAGDRVKAAREQRSWTQEQLAGAAGISKGFLSDVENNKRNISSESALKIADALGIYLDYLLRGESGRRAGPREPVKIPPELSDAAEDLRLTYAQTLTLLEAHEAVIARRSSKSLHSLSADEWKKLHQLLTEAFPDASETAK